MHSMLTHFPRFLVVGAALLATRMVFAGTPEPRDRPYPGTLTLSVEATDLVHRIYTVHERIPVKAGELTLLFPKWLPGHHSPGGPIESLTGLHVSASGQEIEWLRDPLDVYAFHLKVPSGIEQLEVAFVFVAAFGSGEPTIRPDMFDLHWNEVVLYPAGYYDRGIQVAANLTLPAGWDCATALERIASASTAPETEKVSFRPTSLKLSLIRPFWRASTRAASISTPARSGRSIWMWRQMTRRNPLLPRTRSRSIDAWCRRPTSFSARNTSPTMTFCSPSARTSLPLESNTTARARTASIPAISRSGTSSCSTTTFWPTSSRTPGTESFAVQRTCGRRTPTLRCRIVCCGSTRV